MTGLGGGPWLQPPAPGAAPPWGGGHGPLRGMGLCPGGTKQGLGQGERGSGVWGGRLRVVRFRVTLGALGRVSAPGCWSLGALGALGALAVGAGPWGPWHGAGSQVLVGMMASATVVKPSPGRRHRPGSCPPTHVSPRSPASPQSRAETQSPCRAPAELHGLGSVFVPGLPALCRLLWAGAFPASLGAFLLKVRERVRHHATYPRVTVLDEAEGRVLVFPAITLCN